MRNNFDVELHYKYPHRRNRWDSVHNQFWPGVTSKTRALST